MYSRLDLCVSRNISLVEFCFEYDANLVMFSWIFYHELIRLSSFLCVGPGKFAGAALDKLRVL